MDSTTLAKGIFKAILLFCALLLAIWFLYQIKIVIAYLLIAAVVALIGRPLVVFLNTRVGLPNVVSVVLTLLLILSILALVLIVLVPLLSEQSENLSLLKADNIQGEIDDLFRTISQSMGASPEVVEEIVKEADLDKVVPEVEKEEVPTMVQTMMDVIASIGIGLLSVLFISFFYLKDGKLVQGFILNVFAKEDKTKVMSTLKTTRVLLSRYFVGLLVQMGILFLFYSLTLMLVGVKNANVIALMCALFNIIPYFGPLLGALIMLALTMGNFGGADFDTVVLPKLGYVMLGVVIGQLVDNFFSQPYIFSNSVKSHPLEIFLIIIIAGFSFGILGMVVAVPTYTVLKVILKEFMADSRLVRYMTSKIKI